jgi:hypothetical protein
MIVTPKFDEHHKPWAFLVQMTLRMESKNIFSSWVLDI